MSDSAVAPNRAKALRDVFDSTYAVPHSQTRSQKTENLLSIRAAGNVYAIKLSEISGLINDRKTVALPSPIPELLGVAGIRGVLVPIYSLAALLGYNREAHPGRWFVLCGNEEPVGLGFSDFEGYLQVPQEQFHAATGEMTIRDHTHGVVGAADVNFPIVDIPSVLETIRRRYGQNRLAKKAAV